MFDTPIPPFPTGEPAFIPGLRQGLEVRAKWDFSAEPAPEELDLRKGIVYLPEFKDMEKLLETASDELLCFLKKNGISTEGGIPLRTVAVSDLQDEAFRINVTGSEIRLEAGAIEGVRRALYFLEEQLAGADSPFLKIGITERKPWLKNRISRCFFGPIKRPPFNIDELMNDIDYYPENYLARLAREGVNGLWLTVVFREICKTSFLPEDPHAEKRLEKLRRSVEKCRRYGIKIWVFCIEPSNWNPENPCPAEHPEWIGPGFPTIEPMNSFCPNSESAARYLYESTKSIFDNVPHLGGMITISHGERITSCLSMMNAPNDSRKNPCDGKCQLEVGEILAKTLGPMAKGIHDANPEAELISWLYMPYPEQISEWIYRLPEKLDENVILAFNFESGVNKVQLGKIRSGGDYWLSAVGPSDRFGRIAATARGRCSMAAKLQVCCSHEIASVPFVPVPGLVYRKYKAMKALGVGHVIQCWYFGNYPGLMNRAAGKLAFEDFDSRSESEFLEELALPDWGGDASGITEVWARFADGYGNYPLDNMIQYYSPMHHGPVWPLHLKQVMRGLPRTWLPDAEPAGDAIGECMQNHTLAENVILTRRISCEWHKGLELFRKIMPSHSDSKECRNDGSLYEALDILFNSCANIFEFYQLRSFLMDSPENSLELLDSLERLVRTEIANSRRLAELCKADPRLGYHSEAEVFKFYPGKLLWRAEFLEHALSGDFREVRTALNSGKKAEELICMYNENVHYPGVWYNTGSVRWKIIPNTDHYTIHVECGTDGVIYDEMLNLFIADKKTVKTPWMTLQIDRWRKDYPKYKFFDHFQAAELEITDMKGKWIADVKIPSSMLDTTFWFGFRRFRSSETVHLLECYPESGKAFKEDRLGLLFFRPEYLVPVKTSGDYNR